MSQSNAPMRILLVDDEAPARARLKDVLADCGPTIAAYEIVGEAANGLDAIEALSAEPNLILLDIRMPEMDGIEFARHLLRLPHPPCVIFTTAYDDYAVQAFEVNAIDYLLKPIRRERLAAALAKVRPLIAAQVAALGEALPKARTHLSAYERGRILLVPLEDVVYLKAELKYVTARTPEREYILEESLTKLEQEFPDRFLRVHRNSLVARDHIAGFARADAAESPDAGSGWVVLLKGLDETLPVSRRQQQVIKAFTDLA